MEERESDIEIPTILEPCNVCHRTFRPEALIKHSKVCSNSKKRKQFDSMKQRIQGTELAEYLPVLPLCKKPEKSPVRKSQSKWKEKHTELVRTIHAARYASGGDATVPIKPSDHEKCPYCERYFGPKAFDRHLEWCKEQRIRIQQKSPASLQAKERLEARTKYRAPMAIKSRKMSTKEKYSPQPKAREPSPAALKNAPMPKISASPVPQRKNSKEPVTTTNFSRVNSFRGSKRMPSPVKKTSPSPRSVTKLSVGSNETSLTPVNSNGRDDKNEDLFSSSCTITPINPSENIRPKIVTSSRKNSTSDENYNPFLSAERQMLELLEMGEGNKSTNNNPLDTNPIILSSSTSAFTKFSPTLTPGSSPTSESEKTIPPPFTFEDPEAPCVSPPLFGSCLVRDKNRNPISLSSLSLCSSISIESADFNRNGYRRGISFSAKTPEHKKENVFHRSISLADTPRKGRLKMEDLLYGSSHLDNDRYFGSPIPKDHFAEPFKSSNEQLNNIPLQRTVSDEEMFNAEQELLKSISEYKNLLESPSSESLTLFPSLTRQEPLDRSRKEKNKEMNEENKSGPDSAYNSLNRKSPLNEIVNMDPGTRSPHDSEYSPSPLNAAAKFCHECGNKYPVSAAKFCCNCGVKRLII